MNRIWQFRDRVLTPGKPVLVMGIVNVTPDSFSDGGRFADADRAVAHALELVRQGANILDIGGESSRPGAQPVPGDEELARVLPVVERLVKQTDVPLSIDTAKAVVAEACLRAGAHVINDITALTGDAGMAEAVRRHRAGVVLMHMQGTPQTMQMNPTYGDVVADVGNFLQARLQAIADLGIAETQVVFDPGIGFGKTLEHNLRLLARLDELAAMGRPVCLGVSRKGMFGKLLGRDTHQRRAGSLAVACHAMARDSAHILRVHDVEDARDAVLIYQALAAARW
jgi:dihydropteroate synthase